MYSRNASSCPFRCLGTSKKQFSQAVCLFANGTWADCTWVVGCSAMGGTMTFQEALEGRLSLMNVSRSQVAAFLADHPPRLSKGTAL